MAADGIVKNAIRALPTSKPVPPVVSVEDQIVLDHSHRTASLVEEEG